MDRKEILRYLQTNTNIEDPRVLSLVEEAAAAVEAAAQPKTLYRFFPCTVTENDVTVEGVTFRSRRLAETLSGCRRVVVFGATLGLSADRLIRTAMATDTAKGMAYNAAASAYIETVCDALEEEIKKAHGVTLRRRYSPGYYDLDITEQRKLFSLIEITKRIGITLTESCQMAPSKSVTALIGIEDKE